MGLSTTFEPDTEDVANALLLDDDTIRGWRKLYEQRGIEGLTSFDMGGSASFLSAAREDELKAWVAATLPRSTRCVGAWIEQRFGLVYESRSGLIPRIARERGVPLKPRLIERFERRYGGIVAEGLALHEARPPLAEKGAGKRRGRVARADPRIKSGEDTIRWRGFRRARRTRLAFLARSVRSLHQQSGRTRHPHDETEPENLRGLPAAGGSKRLRAHPLLPLDRQAGLKIIEALTNNPLSLAKSLRSS